MIDYWLVEINLGRKDIRNYLLKVKLSRYEFGGKTKEVN